MKREWNQGQQRWGCDASDHGPFCRQCVLIGRATPTSQTLGLAIEIVDAVWRDLMGRSGFGSALDDEPQMEDEIRAELAVIVQRFL